MSYNVWLFAFYVNKIFVVKEFTMLKKIFLSSTLLLLVAGCDLGSNKVMDRVTYNEQHQEDTTFFGFDSAELSVEEQKKLDIYVEKLNKNKSEKILIVGHCDERGTREYNIGLGERRANYVKSYLVSKGVDSSQIRVDSMGKEALRCDTTNSIYNVVSGDKDMYHRQNRRAVISDYDSTIDHNRIIKQERMRCVTPSQSIFDGAFRSEDIFAYSSEVESSGMMGEDSVKEGGMISHIDDSDVCGDDVDFSCGGVIS